MAKDFDCPQGGVLSVPENHFEIDRSTHIRTSTVNKDICLVGNVNSDNLAIAKGIVSQLCPGIKRGNDLLKRMTEYADAGIGILRVEYENNGTLRLDNYIE